MAQPASAAQEPGVRVGLLNILMPPLTTSLRAMRLARWAGLDFMLFGDHVQSFVPRAIWDQRLGFWVRPASSPHELLEAFTTIGRLSTAAGGMQLGVGVADVLRRHPVVLAQAAVSLSHFLRRPFILGLGAGERVGTEPYGLDPVQRAGRLDEAARYIRKALESGRGFTFDGAHFRADDAIMDLPAPAGRRPLIWIAAHGPRSLEVAGRVGDGWLPTHIKDPAEYERMLRTVQKAARAAGRPDDAVTPALELDLMVARTSREAHELLDSRSARFTAAMAPAAVWREAGVDHPFGPDFRGYWDILPERLDPAVVEEAMRSVPMEVIERHFLWGSPDRVTRELEQLRDAGLRAVCFIPASLHTVRLTLYTFWAMRRIRRRLASGRAAPIPQPMG